MGRIKTMLIKRTANRLVKDHKEAFTTDFNDNKKTVEEFADIPSKKLRNVIAGYVTRLTKQHEE
jgi:small subunit ribosomal protein S17e